LKRVTHHLYFWVLVAVLAGGLLGYFAPQTAVKLKPLGDGFIALVKMLIGPVIFCTVVLGIAGVAIAVPLAYGAARGMSSLLFGVQPEDPVVYAVAALLALMMTLMGSLRPGIRAASVDPVITMRAE